MGFSQKRVLPEPEPPITKGEGKAGDDFWVKAETLLFCALLGFQCIKHQVYRIIELLVILTDFHGVDELNEGGEVLFLDRKSVV